MVDGMRDITSSSSVSEAAFVSGSGVAVNDNSTFGGFTLQQIAQALILRGILAV